MSEFSVNVVRIDRVEDHPNADRLTLNYIGGYVAISNKNEDGSWRYKPGDLVVYIPEQSVIPEWLLRQLGMWDEAKNKGVLGGPGNVVKAIRLRQIFSQGILYPVLNVGDHKGDLKGPPDTSVKRVFEDDDVAEFLGITKYEVAVPEKFLGDGVFIGPEETISYGVENYQKFPDLIRSARSVKEELARVEGDYARTAEIASNPPDKAEFIHRNMNFLFGVGWQNIEGKSGGEQVVITEKIHGTNIQIGIRPNLDNPEIFEEGKVYVGSKGLSAKGIVFKNYEDNTYTRVYHRLMKNELFASFVRISIKEGQNVTFIGEVFGEGIQDLGYGSKSPSVRFFDIYVGKPGHGHYVDDETLNRITWMLKIDRVPVLYRGPFSKEIAEKYRDGKTTISENHIREGVVIRPIQERYDNQGNRIQLKYVSPDYLLRKNATEFN